jgi:exodeoxyribonuclease V beta subunit
MTVFDAASQPLLGVHAIEASAGTGKTYTINLLWLRLLIEERLPVQSILVCTFTKAATAELRDRLRGGLRDALEACRRHGAGESLSTSTNPVTALVHRALNADPERDLERELVVALSAFDLAPISTIHGFCTAIIARHGLELGADPQIELEDDCSDLLDVLVDDMLVRVAAAAPLKAKDARKIARRVASETGVDPSNCFYPAPARSSGLVQWKTCADAVSALRDDAHRRLPGLGLGRSLDKSLRIVDALSEGKPAETFAATVQRNLAANFPALWKATQAAHKAIADLTASSVHDLVEIAHNDLPRAKQHAGRRSFDDLLVTVRDALAGTDRGPALAAAIRERFQALMIDECQDSDGVQIAVFRDAFLQPGTGALLDPTRSFLVIGDPKQSIYRFRGADLASYRSLAGAAQRAPEMRTNWRSDRALVEALNGLYANRPEFDDQAADEPIRYVEVDAASEETRLADPGPFVDEWGPGHRALLGLWTDEENRNLAKWRLADQVARECRRLLGSGSTVLDRQSKTWRPLRASDCAVLAGTRADLDLVRDALGRHGIASQVAGRGTGSVLHSAEANDWCIWLEALAACEAGGGRLLGRLLAFTATPLGAHCAAACERLADDPVAQAELAARLKDVAREIRLEGPLPALARHTADPAWLVRELGQRGGERRITNWRHLGSLLQATWADGDRDAAALAQRLGRMMAEAEDDELAMLRLETDLPAVTLSTIHGSKGLEYPVVFCPFLWELKSRQFRKRRKVAVVRDPAGSLLDIEGTPTFAMHREIELAQEDEELQRITYVALTRARHRCYIGLAPVPDSKGGRHENGAARSPINHLLGCGIGSDPADWPDRLHEHAPLIERILDARAEAVVTEAATAVSETLPDAPDVDPWRGPAHRTTSYSALARGEHAASLARDHDEGFADYDAGRPSSAGLLEGLGGGAALGDRIHGILEQVIGNRRSLDAVVDPDAKPVLHRACSTILGSPLGMPGERDEARPLIDWAPQAIAELHFLLPVQACSPGSLSRALLADPLVHDDPDRRIWAEGIATWRFETLRGFLQGYIDLTVQHGERWSVVDYKTNQLPDYDRASCEQAMLENHYLLQGRIYLLALHRHLSANMDDYDLARHLGGIGYWFLRGFPNAGTWQERPSPEAILALHHCFAEDTP